MYYFHIAARYLRGGRQKFPSAANILSFAGITIGVFSLLVVSSVMNGFDSDMRQRVIGSKAEIKVYQTDYAAIPDYWKVSDEIASLDGVRAVAPVCEAELMLQNRKNIIASVCYGIDFAAHREVTDILNRIRIGDVTREDLENDGIILGLDMSVTLNATVGEYVQLSSPLGTEPSPFGLLPRNKRLKVVGIFISGLPEYDKIFSYVSLKNAQYLMSLDDRVDYLDVKTYDPEKSARMAQVIGTYLGDQYKVEDWSDFESNLFNAIKMEKIIMFLVLTLMIIITSFNMTGNFIKLVAEKKTDLGILKALGAQESDIVKILLASGLIIGSSGAATATLAAIILLKAQEIWHFISIPVPGFPLHWVPVELRWTDFLIAPLLAIVISLLTTLYPARKTLRIDVIKIIRE
ncbi:MAG: ABC transporter permease [Candidatus Cloacimonetes bacterium]|nr:ABC transporter permease [Candidatus Cloacimonadota bacterium]